MKTYLFFIYSDFDNKGNKNGKKNLMKKYIKFLLMEDLLVLIEMVNFQEVVVYFVVRTEVGISLLGD